VSNTQKFVGGKAAPVVINPSQINFSVVAPVSKDKRMTMSPESIKKYVIDINKDKTEPGQKEVKSRLGEGTSLSTGAGTRLTGENGSEQPSKNAINMEAYQAYYNTNDAGGNAPTQEAQFATQSPPPQNISSPNKMGTSSKATFNSTKAPS
jgi:hypothetical protein